MTDIKEEFQLCVYGSCNFSHQLNDDISVGDGGYGVVITSAGVQVNSLSAGFSSTTNARMDLMGIIAGIKTIQAPSNILVYLSNGYIIDALNNGSLEKWSRSGYKKIKHAELWKELDKLVSANGHHIECYNSKTINYTKQYLLAERLAKSISDKKNLPIDLHAKGSDEGLFASSNENITDYLELEDDKPVLESICVDASSIGNPGVTEYRGVDTKTKEILFQHRYEEATNNIGEFLAIVHALALYKKSGKDANIIYSDSAIAITWVLQKKCKTKYLPNDNNAKLFEDIKRAVTWLENNTYETKILKWNTGAWGDIIADYGRK